MINYFKDNAMRNSGVIYDSTFEQIKKLYAKDPQTAGELAISAIELVLTGDMSTDDGMIDILLEPLKVQRKKDKVRYDQKIEAQKMQKITSQKLDEIAALVNAGVKQSLIASRLGLTQQTVSNRLKTIRLEFPELLQANEACTNDNKLVQVVQSVQTNNDFVQAKNVCTNPVQEENACTNSNKLVQNGTTCTKFVPLVESEVQMNDQVETFVEDEKPSFYF